MTRILGYLAMALCILILLFAIWTAPVFLWQGIATAIILFIVAAVLLGSAKPHRPERMIP